MESAATSTSTITNGGRGDGRAPTPAPAPMPAANAPPPFLVKTYDMVDDPSTDKIVSWSPTNNSFVVCDAAEFARDLLPKYFKHSNFSSFVRQLNTYGFRKVDPDRWEFANEGFLRGQKHLLKSISRRKPAHGQPPHQHHPNAQSSAVAACVEVGKFGLEEEVERLKRDKNVLMQELVRLRQQQQATDGQLQAMVQRLQGMEQRQQQMMSFLAKAVNSPGFFAQFMQQPNDSSRRIMEGNKKRRFKPQGVSDNESVSPSNGQIVKYQPLINEAAKAMLRQIMKLDSSPRLGNFSNVSESFMIVDGSAPTNVLDCGSSSNRVSGMALQEVAPTSGTSFNSSGSAIANGSSVSFCEVQSPSLGAPADQFQRTTPLIGAQEEASSALPPNDIIMPELSEIVPECNVDVLSETNAGVCMDPTSLDGDIPLDICGLSPDPQMEWEKTFVDDMAEFPGPDDPFWVKFLQSPPPGETDMDSTVTDDLPDRRETKQSENGWVRSEHLAELTEQMGPLSSDAKI